MRQRVQELGRLDKGTHFYRGQIDKASHRLAGKGDSPTGCRVSRDCWRSASISPSCAALYRTVPGVGPLTSATLVAYLPELGCWDSKSLTSLVGLAPWSRDSGKKRGNRAIRGGRGSVRSALYLCAWSVIRHDIELRGFYQNLRQRGKPGNVAVVAVMRKLLLQLNAVARRGTSWVPKSVPIMSS